MYFASRQPQHLEVYRVNQYQNASEQLHPVALGGASLAGCQSDTYCIEVPKEESCPTAKEINRSHLPSELNVEVVLILKLFLKLLAQKDLIFIGAIQENPMWIPAVMKHALVKRLKAVNVLSAGLCCSKEKCSLKLSLFQDATGVKINLQQEHAP